MAVEVVAGILASSLALLSDAAHMLTDAGAIALALVASRLASRPPSRGFTFGLKRAEILSAQVNGATLVALAAVILLEGVRRLVDPPDVEGTIVLAVALAGIAVNLAATWVLAGADRRSLNVEGAFQHVLTDLFAFVATAVAGAVLLTGFTEADGIAALLVAALMLRSGWALLRDSGRVLLEASPRDLDPDEIGQTLASQPHVVEVHDLHVWEVTSGMPSLSAHVTVGAGCDTQVAPAPARRAAARALRDRPHHAPGRGPSRGPAGDRAAAPRAADRLVPRFVIQQHAATSMHWDFRLEVGGTFRSWAVPKGPSTDPRDKRLAMAVDDHALAWGDFEGVIPEGEYGAGPVIVWDRGTYENLRDEPMERRARGRPCLVLARGREAARRLVAAPHGGRRWLLVKRRDEEADARRTPRARSPSRWSADARSSTFASRARPEGPDARPALQRGEEPQHRGPLQHEQAAAAARRRRQEELTAYTPMKAVLTDEPFSDPGWVFERKLDGIRCLAHRDGGGAVRLSRAPTAT